MIIRGLFWWLIRAVLAVSAAVGLWVGGGLTGFDESARLAAVVATLIAWGAWERALGLRVSRAAADPEPEADPAPLSRRMQGSLIRRRLAEAAAALRQLPAHLRGRYALPWYLVLGPHGAGKTALIANSGLVISGPTPSGEPTQAVAPLVTGEAVFFDVSGDYVTDTHLGRVEASGWRALIAGLKRQRPLLPLNGVLLALSPADLVLADSIERAALGAALRARLAELERAVGLRLPVYVLLSKLDLTPGFVEYFDRMDVEQRRQAWGFLFPNDDGRTSKKAIGNLGSAFDALLEDLKRRQLDLLHRETDRSRAAMILGFPTQVAALKPAVEDVLNTVFRSDERNRHPLLRGVYFTSARQDLVTLDSLLPAMASRFGLPPNAAPPPDLSRDEAAFGWFITRPLREAILPEAGLVFRQRNPYRGRSARQWAFAAAVVGVCCAIGLSLSWTFADHMRRTRGVAVALQSLGSRPSPAPGIAGDADLLRAVAVTLPSTIPSPLPDLRPLWSVDPTHLTLLRTALDETANTIAVRRILPRVVGLVQDRLADTRGTEDTLGANVALYRTLGGMAPVDPAALKQWLSAAMEALIPGDDPITAINRRVLVDRTKNVLLTRRYLVAIDHELLAYGEKRLAGGRP